MVDSPSWSRLKARLEFEEAKARMDRQVNDWLDEAVRDFEAKGGLEHVQGKGKPLRIETGDPINGVLKAANVKPPWLELQHEIRDGLRALKREFEQEPSVAAQRALEAINLKISRYNALVPHYSMQKAKIDPATLVRQSESWE
ncbi:DnaJ family domain-containing protein [Paenibacillus sp.]|uniref:DnaJ family domain-containing protein n=1 Tax=Paenibacillus sp. TaxID=58172 RepID=UPI002811C2D7|nr:DnaJ family domain-containing protein [Paenibacillus sp.]